MEQALPDAEAVVAWICGPDPGCADQFLALWGAAAASHVAAYDDVALFNGKAKGANPRFTDFTRDNLGIARNPEKPFWATDPQFNPRGLAGIDPGLGDFLASRVDYQQYANLNYGKRKVPTLRKVGKRPAPGDVKGYGHDGFSRSPWRIVHGDNTRDVLPVSGPGVVTEAQALANNCWPLPALARNRNTAELEARGLTKAEEDALVAFLLTLDDGWPPAVP